MKKLSRHFIVTIIVAIFAIVGLNFTPSTHAYDICTSNASPEVKAANGCGGTSTADIQNVIVNIINSVVATLGLVAVVFIVVGGINYMTSAGDAGKIEKAKKTILYAVIGLIICALAFAIINFVVGIINK